MDHCREDGDGLIVGDEAVVKTGCEVSRTPERGHWAYILGVVILLSLGLAARIFGAWAFANEASADSSRVVLMAKHMAEGRAFPIFFYGAHYMGSFEAAVSALLSLIFGASEFVFGLGNALLAFLVLPILYRWGRETGGRAAGLVGMACCLVGSYEFFYIMGSPRGGYAVTVTFGTAMLWLAGRVAYQEWEREHPPLGVYALLGILGGIAWWSNQLVTASLVASAGILAIGLRGRILQWRVMLAALCFLVGSGPFWFWNATQGWQSLQVGGTLGMTPWATGWTIFRLLFRKMLGIPPGGGVWSEVLWVSLLGAALISLGRFVYGVACRQLTRSQFHRATAWLFVGVFVALFCQSLFAQFRAVRYILPLLPVLAFFVGDTAGLMVAWARRTGHAAAAQTTEGRRGTVRMVCLCGLGLWPLWACLWGQRESIPRALAARVDGERHWRAAQALADFCETHAIEALYADIWEHWVNLAAWERCCVPYIKGEPYVGYAVKSELASRCGVLKHVIGYDPSTDFAAFLRRGGGNATRSRVGFFSLHHTVSPPPAWQWVPPDGALVFYHNGEPVAPVLTDGHIGTGLRHGSDTNREVVLECQVSPPRALAGIRLLCMEGRYPEGYLVEGLQEGEDTWSVLVDAPRRSWFFWSGPRFFWSGLFYRDALRFARMGPFSRLRIRLRTNAVGEAVAVQELHVFEPAASRGVDEQEALPVLLDWLDARGITRLFADRWVSAQVYKATDGRVEIARSNALLRHVQTIAYHEAPRVAEFRIEGPSVAVLVLAHEAALTRMTLKRVGITLCEKALPPWVIFYRSEALSGLDGAGPLVWSGNAVLEGVAETPPEP